MHSKYLLIGNLLNLLIIIKCENFCDPYFNNKLIDTIFNFGDDIYIYREPNHIWLIRYNGSVWTQIGEDVKLSQFFANKGHPLKSFDSAFSISNYEKCVPKQDYMCDRINPEFNAMNVTFVFIHNKYYIYRRINEKLFQTVKSEDNNIPWNANTAKSSAIDSFFKINGRIDSALFVPQSKFKSDAYILSNDSIYVYPIDDKPMADASLVGLVSNSPAIDNRGNGGFMFNNETIIVVDNRFYKYNSDSNKLEDKEMYSWEFFDCDQMQVLGDNESLTVMTNTEIEEESSDSITETTNVTESLTQISTVAERKRQTFTNETTEGSEVEASSEAESIANDWTEHKGIENSGIRQIMQHNESESHHSVTQRENQISTDEQSLSSMTKAGYDRQELDQSTAQPFYIDSDTRFMDQMKVLLIVLFVFILIAVISISIFSVMSYKMINI